MRDLLGPARVDSLQKASGKAVFAADIDLPGLAHISIVRSDVPHARVVNIDTSAARQSDDVIAVVTHADLPHATFGRHVRDMPLLAREKVRFVGEPVAAVVAETRAAAESAVGAVSVEYENLAPVLDARTALSSDALDVHESPWAYPGAAIDRGEVKNMQSIVRRGDLDLAVAGLATSEFSIQASYKTPASHAGYLEPQTCVANVDDEDRVHIWATHKAPYRLRLGLEQSLGIPSSQIIVHPVNIGGDFGGKGPFFHIPLCVALSRLTRRPLKLSLRHWEDLTATNARHSTEIDVRIGCDSNGALTALTVETLADGGAYAAAKPHQQANIRGFLDAASSYRVPALYVESRIAYTNSVPRGHVREPGGPQICFAIESALDELAVAASISPHELRAVNLLTDGEANPYGTRWAEARGIQTLERVVAAARRANAPTGWLRGTGVALWNVETRPPNRTSIRVVPNEAGIRVEVGIPETGTGSHTVVREGVARGLDVSADSVEVVHVPTDELPYDHGVGGSRVTVSLLSAVEIAVERWKRSETKAEPILVETTTGQGPSLTSFCVQLADVAVDPETGMFRVLELVTGVDSAEIINPSAHQMQIDGGAVMGLGFSYLEDLHIEYGQVLASDLGSYKLPSTRDIPILTTVLVQGARGMGELRVKNVGELTNVPTAAAIANAIYAATGVRLRSVPFRAPEIWEALQTMDKFN